MSNISNVSNNVLSARYLHEPLAVEIIRLAVDIFIALSGAFGNILVCIVVTRRFRTSSPINYYILSLAVADLGVLMVNFPFAMIKAQVRTHWPLGKAVCLYIYPTIDVFFGASIWSITAIAIERYRNIVRMANVSQRRSVLSRKSSVGKEVYFVIAAVWFGSFLTTLPVTVHFKYDSDSRLCRLIWPSIASEQVYNVLTVILWYILPLSVITWTYVHIARALRQSTTFHKEMSRQESSGKSKNSRIKQNSKAKRILTPLVVVFAAAMFPINSMKVAFAFWKQETFTNEGFFVMFNLCMTLTTVNSACNALIYSIVSKEFRVGFKTLLLSWKAKWHNRFTITTTNSIAFNSFRSYWKAKPRSSTNEFHWPLPQEYKSVQETDV